MSAAEEALVCLLSDVVERPDSGVAPPPAMSDPPADPIAAAVAMAAAAASAAIAASASEFQASQPMGGAPPTLQSSGGATPEFIDAVTANTSVQAGLLAAEAGVEMQPEAEGSTAMLGPPAETEVGTPKAGASPFRESPRASDSGAPQLQPHSSREKLPGGRSTAPGSSSRPPSRGNSRLGTPVAPDPAARFNSTFDFTNERLVDHTWRNNDSKVRA